MAWPDDIRRISSPIVNAVSGRDFLRRFPALGKDAIASALYLAQPLPTIGLNRPAIALANEPILFKGDNATRGILVQIVLDQFGDQIVAIKVEKIVPEARYPIGLGNKLASELSLMLSASNAFMILSSYADYGIVGFARNAVVQGRFSRLSARRKHCGTNDDAIATLYVALHVTNAQYTLINSMVIDAITAVFMANPSKKVSGSDRNAYPPLGLTTSLTGFAVIPRPRRCGLRSGWQSISGDR